jgi:hypothetical protein
MAAEAGVAAGIIIMVVLLWLAIMAAAIFSFIFWIWMIVDCAQRDFKGDNKVVWILILVFLGILGAIIYYFVVKIKIRK